MQLDALELLKRLIVTPSTSRDETRAADIIEYALTEAGVTDVNRTKNNVWAIHPGFDQTKKTLLINSHIDTVKPTQSWTRDPFSPTIENGRLYGLGSNDAGASLVSLAKAFVELYTSPLPYNLIYAATAEEEVMGENGMRLFLKELFARNINIDMAMIGEPTGMQPAIGERGLLVIDATTRGQSGHAARNEGVNAIYRAMADISKIINMQFPRQSRQLGPIKISVTQIQAGTQHNVVPDVCRWVADVRTTDAYSNPEVVEMLQQAVESELQPRSTHIWASLINETHPLVKAATASGGITYVSPTTSDMALLHNIPSLKIGPGNSARSHTADEYILLDELFAAAGHYKSILTKLSSYI